MFKYIFLLIFLSKSYEIDPSEAGYKSLQDEAVAFYCGSDKDCIRNLKFHLRKNCGRHCDSKNAEVFKMEKRKASLTNLFQSTLPLPCSCQSSYRLMDIGPNYFPRYIPTAECQPITCWNPPYSCREKSYKVQVFRVRGTDSTGQLEPIDLNVPENIRDYWISELLSVTVACECTT